MATKYERDVTIEDDITPVNLLCSSKVTYPMDFFVHPKTTEAAALGYLVEVVQEA